MALHYPHRQKQLQRLIEKLGLKNFSSVRWDLLDLALTHPTASPVSNYEQLEFVGDSVIRLATAEFLLEQYPDFPVGEFTAIRSILVSDRVLARIAEFYNLERHLLIADSALKDSLGKESRLAEAFEAVLAALYLSTHTLELIHPWLDTHLEQLVTEIRQDPARQNYKAALQEWTQAHYKLLPEYRIRKSDQSNPALAQFIAEVWLLEKRLGWGSGRSIKAAEQAAAQVAFLAVTNHPVKSNSRQE
jgi:ribonuclease-3